MTTSNNPPSAVPRLGPAWRGKGSGFQPPPAVPDAERRPPAGTTTNANHGTRDRSNSNPFSALEDEEEGRFSHLRSSGAATGTAFTRSSSTGLAVPSKPRSLADLAASVPRRGSASAGTGGGGGESEKVLRYTREKLLSLRPRPVEADGGELPEILKHLEGSVVVSRVAQDPVCWDDFNPEEIWAAPPPTRERRTTDRPLLKPLDRSSSGGRLRDVHDSVGDDSHPSSGSGAARSRSTLGSSTGRWQRGVALPPGNSEDNRRSDSGGGRREFNYPEAEDPNDLWDDPGGGGTGAAPDFSQFGASLEEDIPPKGKSGLGSGAFELSDISRAAAAFEMELHGEENGKGSEENGEGGHGGEDSYSHRVDESRPLASSGTTIRSGSGDHVNVFEDFGEEEEEVVEEQEASSAESAEKAEEEDVPIKSGNEMSASSRLMKMIGVGGSGGASSEESTTPVESKTEEPPVPKAEEVQVASVPSNPWGAPVSIPSNPWGDPVVPDQSGGLSSLLSAQRAREAEIAAQRQREEEQRRRLMQEEEEKKRWAELQAKQQAEAQAQQQQQQLRQQQQNQVELVLIERISNILENSWGRSDLVSILSTLHADDSRVIAILSNPDALRALINRHPQRIALVRDPAMGAEMAALILTNQQWQMQQARLAQQQQAQAQAREQQELQRRRALEAQQQRQRLEAIAREREAQERQMQLLQQQQQNKQTVIADAPWFYADPQGNIQGPFGGDEMRQWLEAGYFKGNLPISQNNSGPFRPLSTYFPDPSTAFQPRVDEARAQAEARQKQAELAAAAELKRREEEAARAQAESQQRELEARARLKAEAESRMRAEEDAARVKAEEEAKNVADVSNQNDQSVQLKMLLGLGGSSDATVSEIPPAPQPAAKKQSKSKTQQKQTSAAQETSSTPVTEVASAPSAPAWGGAISASTTGRKKSMSEIQQEEAKAAAKRAAEGGGQRSGGGWANVAATGGSTAWGDAAAKIPAAGVIAPNTAVIAGATCVQKINATRSAATITNTQSQQQKTASNKDAVDNFGANGKMTPAFEKWCISQMQKINNSDDLTLVSFCMTLTDPIEIRQYLTAYLGSTPEVNNFASEFIKKKGGDNGRQEEWESAGGPKKGRKKKGGK